MITEDIKCLFAFIDFLHDSTDYLLGKQESIDEVMELHRKRNQVNPSENYKDRIEYNKIQKEFIEKFSIVKRETCDLILGKAAELDIAAALTPILVLKSQSDLNSLREDFHEDDLPEIFEAKRKYFEFRLLTKSDYFLQLFFHDLDRFLRKFFDYFGDSEVSEFNFLNSKTATVTDLEDIETMLKQGKGVKVNLEWDVNNIQIQKNHIDDKVNIADDFRTEYRKTQQMGNTSIELLRKQEQNIEFMMAFRKEFYNAPKLADVTKYWRKFFMDQQISDGLKEKRNTGAAISGKNIMANFVAVSALEEALGTLSREFEQMIVTNKIPRSCMTNNIQKTNIYRQFKAVQDLLNDFKEMKDYSPSSNDLLRQAQEFGLSIIREIEKIAYEPIRKEVAKVIITDGENIYLSLPSIVANITGTKSDAGSRDKMEKDYRKIKMHLDNYLSNYLSGDVTPVNTRYNLEQGLKKSVVKIKPNFTTTSVESIFSILKDFFSTEDQNSLALILRTGDDSPKPLSFKDAGNRLTDTFKKLIQQDFITGCQKKDLIEWIVRNFEFQKNGVSQRFLQSTVEKTISRNMFPCKSPLIEIVDGQIQKTERPKKKKTKR